MQKYYETQNLTLTLTNDTLLVPIREYLIRNKAFLEPYETVDLNEYFPSQNPKMLVAVDKKKFDDITGLNLWIKKRGKEDIIGSVSLSSIMLNEFSSAYFSYRLDCKEIRKGYMEEACRKCIDIAFNEIGIHRLVAMIMLSNTPSLRLAHKLGFFAEGIANGYAKINSIWEDHVQMALINERL